MSNVSFLFYTAMVSIGGDFSFQRAIVDMWINVRLSQLDVTIISWVDTMDSVKQPTGRGEPNKKEISSSKCQLF